MKDNWISVVDQEPPMDVEIMTTIKVHEIKGSGGWLSPEIDRWFGVRHNTIDSVLIIKVEEDDFISFSHWQLVEYPEI